MSNIIKKGHLVMVQQPLILDSLVREEDVSIPVIENAAENSEKQVENKKSEAEQLKQENDDILAETRNMVVELLEKARREAKAILANARDEADDIHLQANQEADHIRAQAREEGYQAGLKQAEQETAADRQNALQESRTIMEAARQTKLKTMASMEKDICRLVLAVSRKVVTVAINSNPDVILNIVRQALSFLDNPENVTVYVNPQDLKTVLTGIKNHKMQVPGRPEVAIEARPADTIKAGGCLLESDSGRVDACLETRMGRVEKAVMEMAND